MAKFPCMVFLTMALGACASRVPTEPPADPPSLRDNFREQIEMVENRHAIGEPYSKTPYAVCAPLANAPYGWVFAWEETGRRMVTTAYAALFEEAGLLVRGVPPARFAEPYRQEKGVWYRFTAAALPFAMEPFSPRDQLCFGRRSPPVVTDLGQPVRTQGNGWKRLVHYEITVSDMPAFTQTDRFKKLVLGARTNGVERKTVTFFWVTGGTWETPLGVIRPEEIE